MLTKADSDFDSYFSEEKIAEVQVKEAIKEMKNEGSFVLNQDKLNNMDHQK